MKIYIVCGSTEWYDMVHWNVIAYTDKSLAMAHKDNAKKRADEIGRQLSEIEDGWGEGVRELILKTNEYDPEMKMDGYKTNYYVEELELKETN